MICQLFLRSNSEIPVITNSFFCLSGWTENDFVLDIIFAYGAFSIDIITRHSERKIAIFLNGSFINRNFY